VPSQRSKFFRTLSRPLALESGTARPTTLQRHPLQERVVLQRRVPEAGLMRVARNCDLIIVNRLNLHIERIGCSFAVRVTLAVVRKAGE